MRSIFEFSNYQAFLQHWFESRAGRTSMHGFARKARCSVSLVSLVVSGKRRLDEDRIKDFLRALKLKNHEEQEYFRLLVVADSGRSPEVCQEARARADAMRAFHLARRHRPAAMELLRSGLRPVLLELARTDDFPLEAEQLAIRLRGVYPAEAITGELRALIEAGLLTPDATGRLRPGQPVFATDHQEREPASAPPLHRYHEWALETARQGLKLPSDQRRFNATVLAIRPESLATVSALLERLHEELIRLSEETVEGAGEVVLVSTQLVSLTRRR